MPYDVWTPMITINLSLRNKSLRARNKVAHVEVLQGLCRDIETDNAGHKKKISVVRKKEQSQKQNKKRRLSESHYS